jgi:hypothetical protein
MNKIVIQIKGLSRGTDEFSADRVDFLGPEGIIGPKLRAAYGLLATDPLDYSPMWQEGQHMPVFSSFFKRTAGHGTGRPTVVAQKVIVHTMNFGRKAG